VKNLVAALLVPKGSSSSPSPPSGDDEGPSSREETSARAEYAAELAEILGVKERDRDAFAEALHGYVVACHEETHDAEPEDMSESDEADLEEG
jgi:hypothetical protein